MSHVLLQGPGRVVGIATGYGLDGSGIESRWGQDFPHLSRPALGPTQPPRTMGTGSFSGVKCDRGVTLTPHPLRVPWSRKSIAIPLFPLRAVQSLSTCTRMHFTFLMHCSSVLNRAREMLATPGAAQQIVTSLSVLYCENTAERNSVTLDCVLLL